MGIRGLERESSLAIQLIEAFLRQEGLLSTAPLAALSNTRLGIDGNHYIRNILSDPAFREPLVASTGGQPLALANKIEADCRILEKFYIRPVFVFGGLPLNRPPLREPAVRDLKIKNEAWEHYENGDVNKAIQTLSEGGHGGSWTDVKDVMRLILRVFRHRSIEYIVAPYLESAQLAYLLKHPRGYIHAIYGSTETILYPIDKLITSINFTDGSFTFVEKPRILETLKLSDDHFLDLSLLVGCSLSATHTFFEVNLNWYSAAMFITQSKSGFAFCQSNRDLKDQFYVTAFMRARWAIRYSLVLTTEGRCEALPVVIHPPALPLAEVPSDLEETFSGRLPDEVYYLICRAWASPTILGWLTSGSIVEPQPLADSPDYQKFIKDVITEGITSPRTTILGLLSDCLHANWKQRKVYAHFYFDQPQSNSKPLPFSDHLAQALVHRCREWTVPTQVLEAELRRQNSSTLDLKLCIGALDHALAMRDKGRLLEKKDETVSNIIWRFLDVRGFITPNYQQSSIGKALHAGCVGSRVNDKFQESLFLVLELLRSGVLHGNLYGEAYSGGPSFGTPEEQRSTLLIMRTLSVLNLTSRPQQWAGPLSRELLVFNSFVRALSRAMRHLLEAVSVHFVLSGDARRNRDDYLEIVQSLPFQADISTGFGILAKTYLDAATFHMDEMITEENVDTENARNAKREALNFVESSFSSVKGPSQEVERGFRFWDTVMIAVRTAQKEQGPNPSLANTVIHPGVAEQFEVADKWLRPMRP